MLRSLLVLTVDRVASGDNPGYQYYHYLEIGLCNFETLIEQQPPEQKGLSVEALPIYVEELRKKFGKSHPNTKLINAAVLPTEKDAAVTAFYVSSEDIAHFGLPPYMIGMTRIGDPHPHVIEYLKEKGLPHLMRSQEVPAVSFDKFLDLHQACRIGFLKLDMEGMDVPILNAYVAYMQQHPACWADMLEYEVHPGLVSPESAEDLAQNLASVGYAIVRDERPAPWPRSRPFTIRAAFRGNRPPAVAVQRWSGLIPAAVKVLHLLMPCWGESCDALREQHRMKWAQQFPGWHVEVWSGKRGGFGERDLRINKDYCRVTAKYSILSHFGGALVDWRLNPSELLENVEPDPGTRGFSCLDPGPRLFQHSSGMAMFARPFDPFLQELHHGLGLQTFKRFVFLRDRPNLRNITMRKLELSYLHRIWAEREAPGTKLPCFPANLSILAV